VVKVDGGVKNIRANAVIDIDFEAKTVRATRDSYSMLMLLSAYLHKNQHHKVSDIAIVALKRKLSEIA